MSAGNDLSEARQRAGLTERQISERTKIQLYKIKALERDDYAQLPQGIYLDGIVRAYALEVGIDPEPMVERVRLERGKLPGDWDIPFAGPIKLHTGAMRDDLTPALDDIPVLHDLSVDNDLDGFAAESDLQTAPIPQREPQHEPRYVPQYELGDPEVVPISRIPARPARQRAGLLIPLLALLAAAGLGIYLYMSSTALDHDGSTSAKNLETTRPESANQTTTANVPFSENVITPEPPPAPAAPDAGAASQDTPSNLSTAVTPPQPPAPDPPAESAKIPAASRPESVATSGSSPDVTGSWSLATQIESSSLTRFEGLKLGYEMQLEQDGDRVTGTGRKVTENGNGIGPRAQTPVTVTGTIAGDRLTLTFVERGTRRPTQGKFVLMMDDAGTMRGRFSSNAAQSSGRVEAHRVSAQY